MAKIMFGDSACPQGCGWFAVGVATTTGNSRMCELCREHAICFLLFAAMHPISEQADDASFGAERVTFKSVPKGVKHVCVPRTLR